MAKQKVITTKVEQGYTNAKTALGQQMKIGLPEGCMGLCFVWESKKSAREWYGKKDTPMMEIDTEEDKR